MIRAARAAAVALLAIGSSGCLSVYAHAVSGGSTHEGTPVEVRGEGIGLFMLFAPDLEARPTLEAKCASGRLSTVETLGWVRNWFGVVQVYDVRVRATCNP